MLHAEVVFHTSKAAHRDSSRGANFGGPEALRRLAVDFARTILRLPAKAGAMCGSLELSRLVTVLVTKLGNQGDCWGNRPLCNQ